MAEILNYIDKISNRTDLTTDEASRAFQIMLLGGATPAQTAAFLMGLRVKGEVVNEITGAALAVRAKSGKVNIDKKTFDICGTGNNNPGLLNVSTAVAIVAAGAGVPIAKHGNRAGHVHTAAADVLTCLGVNIDADAELIEKSLMEANICFMMAPKFHAAMKQITPISSELGIRTLFNLVGPFCNPATPKFHMLGVFTKDWERPIAEVLKNTGSEGAWVVHGSDGLDEITITGKSYITELKDGQISSFEIVPEDAGIATQENTSGLVGGEPDYNAKCLIEVINGKEGIYRDIVLLNAAAVLKIYGIEDDLKVAAQIAADSIDSGKAKAALRKLVEVTNLHNG